MVKTRCHWVTLGNDIFHINGPEDDICLSHSCLATSVWAGEKKSIVFFISEDKQWVNNVNM